MSGIIQKAKESVKEAFHSDQSENPRSTNAGPHSSNVANKVDPMVDSDRDHRNDPTSAVGGRGHTQTVGDGYGQTGVTGHTGTGMTGHTGTGVTGHTGTGVTGHTGTGITGHTGTGMTGHTGTGVTGHTGTGMAAHGNTAGTHYDNPRSTNEGPHSSNLANKLDPRVDSDRDGRNDPTSHVGGYGQTQTTGIGHGTTGVGHGTTATTGTGVTGVGAGTTTHHHPTSGVAGHGAPHSGQTQYSDPHSTNAGPHSSNLLNKADPRVDSDRDGRNDPTSRAGGYGATQQDYTSGGGFADTSAAPGHHATTTHHGTHGHGGVAGTTTMGHGSTTTPGSGTAQQTAGPHDSNILNKLDPRVDSDLDGSKTYGGNKTNF